MIIYRFKTIEKMKRLFLFVLLASLLSFVSCEKDSSILVGYWGVERIDFYDVDNSGTMIGSSLETYTFTPGAADGIEVTFYADGTGYILNKSNSTVTNQHFSYDYDESDGSLYIVRDDGSSYIMAVETLNETKLVYINQYEDYHVEKDYFVRTGKGTKASWRQHPLLPFKPGSFLSGR